VQRSKLGGIPNWGRSELGRNRAVKTNRLVCLSVCLYVREDISGTTRVIFTKFMYMLPMSVARYSSGMLTIGRIAYRREGVTGVHSAGEVQSTIALSIIIVGKQKMSIVLQLSLCVLSVIQLTSSQATYDVTPQANDVTSCESSQQSEQVLRQLVTVNSQLMNAVYQLQRDVAEVKADVGDIKANMSQLQRDVANVKAVVSCRRAGKYLHKCSAVAEMGDRLVTIDIGRK